MRDSFSVVVFITLKPVSVHCDSDQSVVGATYVVDCGPIANPVHSTQRTVKGLVTADMLPWSKWDTICLKCGLRRLRETWIMVRHECLEVKWA